MGDAVKARCHAVTRCLGLAYRRDSPLFFAFYGQSRRSARKTNSSMPDAAPPQVDLDQRMTTVETGPKSTDSSHFVQLFAQHQRGIHAYICTLVPNGVDADDVMQETSLVLWRKWEEFDREREFIRWACGIAFNEVLKLRRRVATRRYFFNEALLEQLSAEAIGQSDALQHRQQRHSHGA